MLYSVIIYIPTLKMDVDLEYPCRSGKGRTLERLMDMYASAKGKAKAFRDPRLQGYKGICRAITVLFPDKHSELLYNNGWEAEWDD